MQRNVTRLLFVKYSGMVVSVPTYSILQVLNPFGFHFVDSVCQLYVLVFFISPCWETKRSEVSHKMLTPQLSVNLDVNFGCELSCLL